MLTPAEVATMLARPYALAVTEDEMRVLIPGYERPKPTGEAKWVTRTDAERRRWCCRIVNGDYEEHRLTDTPRPTRPKTDDAGCLDCARDALGNCTSVLVRHGHQVRRDHRTLCVFHDERHPSMAVFEGRDGRSRFYCHACGAHGDVFDLEGYLSRRDLGDTIRTWGRCRCGSLTRRPAPGMVKEGALT